MSIREVIKRVGPAGVKAKKGTEVNVEDQDTVRDHDGR